MKEKNTNNRDISMHVFLLLFFCLFSVEGVFGENYFTKEQFAEKIRGRITDVQEFDFIRNYALHLPLRAQESRPKIYLFGGAATGFAATIYHELKQDAKLSLENNELDISDIYDLIQDVDLVIDAGPEEARALQNLLGKEFPLVQGESTKSLWEVRPLRCGLGVKKALLNNPEISNQHTDSFSCGLIEITKNDSESPSEIRDLLHWDSVEAPYLKDVWRMKNHYRYNDFHPTTIRGQKGGINPPIISALRYLIKVSQYGAYPIPQESEKLLRKVISEMKEEDFRKYQLALADISILQIVKVVDSEKKMIFPYFLQQEVVTDDEILSMASEESRISDIEVADEEIKTTSGAVYKKIINNFMLGKDAWLNVSSGLIWTSIAKKQMTYHQAIKYCEEELLPHFCSGLKCYLPSDIDFEMISYHGDMAYKALPNFINRLFWSSVVDLHDPAKAYYFDANKGDVRSHHSANFFSVRCLCSYDFEK